MSGKVYLVGCGPGDPDLLTIRAVNVLETADVVLYDRLIDDRVLNHTKEESEEIYVGKKAEESDKQEWINELLVSKAEGGNTVARLKNGNPVIFARGGEELQHLRENGIEVEIVPGLSSATSLAPLIGVPLTKRDVSSSLSILTGVGKGGSDPSWEEVGDTGVVLMTVNNLPRVVEKLTEPKMTRRTLSVLISSGSTSGERVLVSELDRAPEMADFVGIEPPSILVAGNVVEELLNIKGQSFAAFRPVHRLDRTKRLVKKSGGVPYMYGICRPKIPHNSNLKENISKDWDVIIFMSPTGVEVTEGLIDFPEIKAIAVGNTTAKALRRHGCKNITVPEKQSSAGVQQLLKENSWDALALRSAMADEDLVGALNVEAYTMEPENVSEAIEDYLNNEPDYTLLTSGGMIEILLNEAEKSGRKRNLIEEINESFVLSIGRKCSNSAESKGLRVNYEFPQPSLESFFK